MTIIHNYFSKITQPRQYTLSVKNIQKNSFSILTLEEIVNRKAIFLD